MVSAIEVYNRPTFQYREETFSILALNAWELLLKAKLCLDAGNKQRAIWVYQTGQLKSGAPSKRKVPVRNRSGNNCTLSIGQCIQRLADSPAKLERAVTENLFGLIEIRDNSTHYFTASADLAHRVAELSVATIRNFVTLCRAWFGRDFSDSFTLSLPLAFIGEFRPTIPAVAVGNEQRLLSYLNGLKAPSGDSELAVALQLTVNVVRTSAPDVTKVQFSSDPDAPKMNVTEEDVLTRFPWDYATLKAKLREKIPGFREDTDFRDTMRHLSLDSKLAKVRHLDPRNPKSGKKTFYSPNIVQPFQKRYAELKANASGAAP